MESLHALTVFVQVAETRSFTAAARQIGLSPSAIGKSIARLEERIGVRLFHRSTRSVALTAEGTVFLERCRRIFVEIEAAEREISQTRSLPSGRLRVSMPIAGMLMMPALSGFVEAYPDVKLDLNFTNRLVSIIDEGFDVVVRTGDIADSRLMSRVLGSSPYRIAGSPSYFRLHGTPKSCMDLRNHRALLNRYPTTGTIEPWILGKGRRKMEPELKDIVVSDALEPLIYMAEQGLGLIFVPEFAVRNQLASGDLVSILESQIDRAVTFRAVWPPTRLIAPKLRVFIDYLAENLFPVASVKGVP